MTWTKSYLRGQCRWRTRNTGWSFCTLLATGHSIKKHFIWEEHLVQWQNNRAQRQHQKAFVTIAWQIRAGFHLKILKALTQDGDLQLGKFRPSSGIQFFYNYLMIVHRQHRWLAWMSSMDSIWGKAKSSVPHAWSYFQRSSLVHLLKAGLRVCMMPFSLGVPAKKSGLTSRNFQGKRSSGYKQVIFRVVLGLREVQRCACFDFSSTFARKGSKTSKGLCSTLAT